MWRPGAISLWKSRSSARQAYRRCCDSTAYVQELFQELRHFSQLPRPHDAQPLARLALRGAQLTPALTQRQRALLAQRLEGLDWCSWEVCEALGEDAESYVDNLLPAEWMLLLRYFTSCGFVHHGFCQAAVAWLQFHEASGKLQPKQLQELLSSLAYAGHLTRELGEEVCKTLKPLPTEAEEQVLVRLATTLASVDVETPEFYRQVLSTVTAPKTVPAGLPAGGAEEAEDYWRLSLLCFLAKADVVRWSLLLNILRQLNPLVAESVPQTLIPRLLWHLHQNCLENDSLLLEAHPLAKQLATQLTAAKRRWASEDLATMAGSLGYLGIIDVRCSEAIWEQLEAAEEEEVAPAMLQAGWAACVASSASSASSQGLGAGHQCLQRQRHALVAALAATKPLERLAQQRRQVALSLQAVQALQQANAADENEPLVMPGRAFFTPHRQKDQLRIARAFTARLRSLGAYCRAKPSWEAVAKTLSRARSQEHQKIIDEFQKRRSLIVLELWKQTTSVSKFRLKRLGRAMGYWKFVVDNDEEKQRLIMEERLEKHERQLQRSQVLGAIAMTATVSSLCLALLCFLKDRAWKKSFRERQLQIEDELQNKEREYKIDLDKVEQRVKKSLNLEHRQSSAAVQRLAKQMAEQLKELEQRQQEASDESNRRIDLLRDFFSLLRFGKLGQRRSRL